MQEIDLLVLGAGWTSTFLVPLLKKHSPTSPQLSYALTSTTGREGTIKFKFDPSAPEQSYFSDLPCARYVLITFPVKTAEDASLLVDSYLSSHARVKDTVRWIVLGSTGIWQPGSSFAAATRTTHWIDRHSAYDKENARAIAEDEYMRRGALVLCLAGLWDGTARDPKQWVERVATTKEAVAGKTSLHMVHGVDVARALVAIIRAWEEDRGKGKGDEERRCAGQRWMLTDGLVYDWWTLFAGWADTKEAIDKGENEPSKQSRWVYELMVEKNVKALPRSMEELGRCYDSREFWSTFGLTPLKARI